MKFMTTQLINRALLIKDYEFIGELTKGLSDVEFTEISKDWSESAREAAREARGGGGGKNISETMWKHEKGRIDQARGIAKKAGKSVNQVLTDRLAKMSDPLKLVTYYHALTDENYHTVATLVEDKAKKIGVSDKDLYEPKFLF